MNELNVLTKNGDDVKIVIHAKKYDYKIILKDNYLGAQLSDKVPLPGENWLRGKDLSDGKPTEATWQEIFQDIVKMEMGESK